MPVQEDAGLSEGPFYAPNIFDAITPCVLCHIPQLLTTIHVTTQGMLQCRWNFWLTESPTEMGVARLSLQDVTAEADQCVASVFQTAVSVLTDSYEVGSACEQAQARG